MRRKNPIDSIKQEQQTLTRWLASATARVNKLLGMIKTLPTATREPLTRLLNRQKDLIAKQEAALDRINLTKPNVNSYEASLETKRIIKEAHAIQGSLRKIEETAQNILARAAINQTTPENKVMSQNKENQVPNKTEPRRETPTEFEELDPDEMESIFADDHFQPSAQTSNPTHSWPQAPSTPIKTNNPTHSWPQAPSTPIKPSAPPSTTTQSTTIRGITRTDGNKSDYQKNQALLNKGKDLLQNKEEGISNRYKNELNKLNKNIHKAENALDQVDAASKALGNHPNAHSDEADALVQEELNKQFPKSPGS